MDKEKAKFILQSFRPDGADAGDPDFAEALELAAADRDLGNWLARERAQDAAFAAALNNVSIPEHLRSAIFEVLDPKEVESVVFDADFIGALAAVQPPDGLRDQILNAMEIEQKVVRPAKGWGWRKLSSISAAAAAVMIGLFVTFGTGGNAIASAAVSDVHESAIAMLSAPLFSLDLKEKRQAEIFDWLQSKELPSPEQIPSGLRNLDGVGCKYLTVGDEDKDAKGSLICFRKNEDTIVHLVMMKKEDLGEELQDIQQAEDLCQAYVENDGWSVTQWSDSEHAFFLFAKMNPVEMAALF